MSALSQQSSGSLAEIARTWQTTLESELPVAAKLREELHANPRLSGDEADTARRVAEAAGLDLEPVAEAGGVARLGPATGPTVLLRAELDALPVMEQTGAEFASTSGVMHACGHDVHLAAIAALAKSAQAIDLPVALLVALQPREETYPSGAFDIIESDALERHDVRHAIGAHVHPRVASGSVATGSGPINAASGEIEITVTGRGGHGAYPHEANDVAACVSGIVLALSELVRRAVNPLHPALISVGTITVGEGGANVLPGTGRIRAMLRTMHSGDDDRIIDAVRRFATAHAEGLACRADVSFTRGEPVLDNDSDLVAGIDEWLPRVGLSPSEPMRSLGADDFSFFATTVPSAMCFVGVSSGDDHDTPSLHDPSFLPDEDAVRRVATTMLAGYLAAAERLIRDGNEPV